MSDTPETDAIAEMAHNLVLDWDCRDRGDTTEKPLVVTAEFARRLERERDELRQVIRYVDEAFPDLDEFQDRNGRPLKWLADKIQKAKGES
jgi:hypothetical protein